MSALKFESPLAELCLLSLVLFSVSVAIHTITNPNIYSDINSVWERPEIHGRGLPYVDFTFEYPAVIGWLLYASSWSNYDLYLGIQGLVLSLSVLGIVLALYKLHVSSERTLIYVVAAPTMLIYGFYNWDLILVAFVMLAIVALRANRIKMAGLLFGLGIATKVYSIVLVPVVLTELKRWKERIEMIAFCALAWVAPNLPFMLLSPSGWMETWIYHKNWGFEDTWLLLLSPNDRFNLFVKLFGFFLLGLTLLRTTFMSSPSLLLRERLLMAGITWLLFSYVSTPQMVLMLLPLFALNHTRYSLFYASEAANVLIILTWFTVPDPLAIWSEPQLMNLIRQSIWAGILTYYMTGKNLRYKIPAFLNWLRSPLTGRNPK